MLTSRAPCTPTSPESRDVTDHRNHVVAIEAEGWRAWRERLTPGDHATAICHLQEAADRIALCGVPWQVLTPAPEAPDWSAVDPDRRCPGCSSATGVDRAGRAD
jgi:hypothetical protein